MKDPTVEMLKKTIATDSPDSARREIYATGKHADQGICEMIPVSCVALLKASVDSLKGLISGVKLALTQNLPELRSDIAVKGVNFTSRALLRGWIN